MRSAPSSADLALLAKVNEDQLAVTITQLERWRQHGLIPRSSIVRDGWGGSRALPPKPETIEAVKRLAGLSTRGRPWQFGGLALFDEGFSISERCIQNCAVWMQERRRRQWARVWMRAEQVVSPDPHDVHGELTDVAFTTANLAKTNRLLRGAAGEVQRRIKQVDPWLSAADLRQATERSLGWRIADMMNVGGLDEPDRLVARYGTDGLPDLASYRPALPSEAIVCARTLTIGEAIAYRSFLIVLDHLGDLELPLDRALLDTVAWEVCEARINTTSKDPTTALPASELQDLHDWVEDAWAAAEGGAHPDQLELFEVAAE